MNIRRAVEDDLPAIARLYGQDNLNPQGAGIGLQSALREINSTDTNAIYVAEEDDIIVGTFQLTYIRQLTHAGGLVAQIEAVRVDGPRRSQGIGAAMMRWAIEAARQRGCVRVQLTSNKQRSDAHRFYARLGFQATHEGFKLLL